MADARDTGYGPRTELPIIRELDLAVRARDYARGDLALTPEGLRLLLLDLAEALEISAKARYRKVQEARPGQEAERV